MSLAIGRKILEGLTGIFIVYNAYKIYSLSHKKCICAIIMLITLVLTILRDSELMESSLQFSQPLWYARIYEAQHVADLYFLNTCNVSSVWLAFGKRGETNDLVIMTLIVNSGCHGGALCCQTKLHASSWSLCGYCTVHQKVPQTPTTIRRTQGHN